ncbi:MAG: DNA polymerase III subunit gamma/tau [Ruminococcaceae bacterium]|nr:DNA polymerase III subunit gamma/tau [Oscillospiraceae bacterium]
MAYQALYRTWRPMVFDDVVGQEHITQTLRNEIKTGNLAHAYLFCGTRGTGKTSTAKILARAVNCLHPVDGNPCNECDICKGILDDSILDVVEMDGASRNKVENIRELIDDVAFLPTRARKKVYIIDEVHMVTTQAFNALLKTLEEPPAHVLFILATTELNKIPPTVLSRCQRFDFKRITQSSIAARLSQIVTAAGREMAPEALNMVAELGDGSMRDALSVLEQVLGYTEDAISFQDLLSIIGMTDYEALFQIGNAFCRGDGGQALAVLDRIIENGKEPDVFIGRLTRFLRDLLVVKLTQNPVDIVNTSPEHLARMVDLANQFSKEKLIYGLKLMNEAVVTAKASGYGRIAYELALVKLSEPAYDTSFEALSSRVADLEKKLTNGVITAQAPAITQTETKVFPTVNEVPPRDEPTLTSAATTTVPVDDNISASPNLKEAENNQGSLLDQFEDIKAFIRTHGGAPILPHINRSTPIMLAGKLTLIFPDDAMMNKTVVGRAGNLELLQLAVQSVMGEGVYVQCLSEKEAGIKQEHDAFDQLLALSKEHKEIEVY